MKRTLMTLLLAGPAYLLGQSNAPESRPQTSMDLGAFSVSLAVKDLQVSRAYYEKLGFTKMGGDAAQNWLILKNKEIVIGLFQGMFETNIMTFNPGWNQAAENTSSFTDIRTIEQRLVEHGIQPTLSIPADVAAKEGPASLMLTDPDGNVILIDQHR